MSEGRKHLLLVTPKLFRRVGSAVYSDGGTPAQLAALASLYELSVLAQILPAKAPPKGWQLLPSAIHWHSLGRVFDRLALVPPLLACYRTASLVQELVERHRPALILLKGPSEVTFAALVALRHARIPIVYHLSLDWLGSVDHAARYTRLRRLAVPYFSLLKQYRRLWLRRALPVATVVATACRDHAEALRPLSRGLAVLPQTFTITEAAICPNPPRRASRGTRFLFVGRLDANKNVDMILKATARLEKHYGVLCEVVICGDGDRRGALEQLTRTLGLSKRVAFVGYVPQLRLKFFYEGAVALILPSFSEVFPKVIAEAFAAGTPVIASAVNGVKDMIKEGENGWFVDPYDLHALMARMKWFLEAAVEKYEAMQASAIRTAYELTREATLKAWSHTLEEAMGAHAVSHRPRGGGSGSCFQTPG